MGELCIIEKWAENLDEATVSRWLVEEGDEVEAGDGICDIITDKATFEFEAEIGGIVRRIYAAPRSTVPVGYVIAFIGAADEDPPADIEERNRIALEQHMSAAEEELDLKIDVGALAARRRGGRRAVRGTPAARKLARDRDVTLEEVAEALGITGVVTEQQVSAYVDEE